MNEKPETSLINMDPAEGPAVPRPVDAHPLPQIRQPYPGLRSFRQDEAVLFFGRDTQARQIRDILAKRNLAVVLGGSGSGKSSLVRAGLLPKLNSTAPIPGRSGAWYAAEFRPLTDPSRELLKAIYEQIFEPLLETPSPRGTGGKSDPTHHAALESSRLSAERRNRHLRAVNIALKIDPPLAFGEEIKDIKKRCKERLRALFVSDNGEFDIAALFEFADERLAKLDEELAGGGARSGHPNLILLIDQFEEVFSLPDERQENELSLIMALVTTIQTYLPPNLFLILTMRNEFLHRCSEFPGVAEAMNRSIYLVDLLAESEVEKVVVEPARLVLREAGLAAGSRETGPYAPATLKRLREAFDEEDDVGDSADRLPLLQHLLPLVWAEAIKDWSECSARTPLSVEVKHLEVVPGWKSENPLSACLNAHAKRVLAEAVGVAKQACKNLTDDDARRFLQAAFSRLAVLDDKGIVRRQFATIDQMLSAAGIVERNSGKRAELQNALSAALEKFKLATLISSRKTLDGELFDINHEALVRNWTTYADWVKRARDIKDRLIDLDKKTQGRVRPPKVTGLARWSEALENVVSAKSLRSAADQVGSETSEALMQDVFGENATFSRDWARKELEADGVEDRVESVHRTINDAARFRGNVWHRHRSLAIFGLVVALCSAISLGFWFHYDRQREIFATNTKNLLLIQHAGLESGDLGQKLVDDRDEVETYAAFKIALDMATGRNLPSEFQGSFANVLSQFDKKVRLVLSRAVWLREGIEAPGGEKVETQDTICETSGDAIWTRLYPGLRHWEPYYMDLPQAPTKGIEKWQEGSIICSSIDGNWQLIWPRFTEGLFNQPVIRGVRWIRLPPNGKHNLFIQAAVARRFIDKKSTEAYRATKLYEDAQWVSEEIRKAPSKVQKRIQFAEAGSWVGFIVTLKDNKTVAFWTIAGLDEPVEARFSGQLVDCAKDDAGCVFSVDKYEAHAEFEPPPDIGDVKCNDTRIVCSMNVNLRLPMTADKDGQGILVKVQTTSTTLIEKGTASKEGLFLQDATGQVWRYVIDPDQMLKLLRRTLPDVDSNFDWTAPCKELNCKAVFEK